MNLQLDACLCTSVATSICLEGLLLDLDGGHLKWIWPSWRLAKWEKTVANMMLAEAKVMWCYRQRYTHIDIRSGTVLLEDWSFVAIKVALDKHMNDFPCGINEGGEKITYLIDREETIGFDLKCSQNNICIENQQNGLFVLLPQMEMFQIFLTLL